MIKLLMFLNLLEQSEATLNIPTSLLPKVITQKRTTHFITPAAA